MMRIRVACVRKELNQDACVRICRFYILHNSSKCMCEEGLNQDELSNLAKGEKARNRKKAALLAFFHRLRPPDEHHKNRRSSQRWRNPTGL